MSIVTEVEAIINNPSHFGLDEDIIKKYEKAIEWFNDMVERGLIEPRGYQLMSREEQIKMGMRLTLRRNPNTPQQQQQK